MISPLTAYRKSTVFFHKWYYKYHVDTFLVQCRLILVAVVSLIFLVGEGFTSRTKAGVALTILIAIICLYKYIKPNEPLHPLE